MRHLLSHAGLHTFLVASFALLLFCCSCSGDEEAEMQGDEDLIDSPDQSTAEGTGELFAQALLAGETIDCQSPLYIGNKLQDLGFSENDSAANCFSFKNDLARSMFKDIATRDATFQDFTGKDQAWITGDVAALRDAEVTLSDNKGFPINRMAQVDGLWYIVYLLNPGGSIPR